MACLICKDLERTLDFRRSKYFEARSEAYYQISSEIAAQKNIDMERAKSDLEEHQLTCVSAFQDLLNNRPKPFFSRWLDAWKSHNEG